jgi:hypothetical protein
VAAQIEHQLAVSGAQLAHLFVFDGQEGLLIERKPQPERWDEIRRAWDSFMRFIETDTPPPLVQRDTRERHDPVWFDVAGRYLEARQVAERADQELEAAKNALIALTSHPSERGAGVVVSRYFRRGQVDYRRIPALAGVDLDAFRGPGGEEVRVTLQK